MAWTAGQLAEVLATEFGKDWTDSENVDQVLSWLNDAFKVVVSYADWPWLKTQEDIALATSASTIALSTSAVYPTALGIVDPQFKKITFIDGTEMVGYDTNVTGQPQYAWVKSYSANQITLQIYPVADDNYTIRVLEVVRPLDLGSGATIPVPEEMIPLIKEYVRYMMLRADGDYYGARISKDEVMNQLDRMKRKPQAAAREPVFARADVPDCRDPRLPKLPGNYPEY